MHSLITMLLAGCASAPAGVAVEWIKTPLETVHDICRAQSTAVLVYGRIYGCTIRTATGCKIYASDFEESETAKMAVLGHELKHCFDRSWHKDHQVYR